MENSESLSEELLIVGSSHGDLADVITPLFRVPMDGDEWREVLKDDEIVLSPVYNEYDENAIAVYTRDLRKVGHLWAGQAPAMRSWMQDHGCDYIRVRITGIKGEAEVLTAHADSALNLNLGECYNKKVDIQWGEGLPEVLHTIEDQSLNIGVMLLREELAVAKEWNDMLNTRIDNILRHIPIDLSAYRFGEGVDVYNLMATSSIPEVRHLSRIVLRMFVKRGSKDQIEWWVEDWLPNFIERVSEGDVLNIYKAAGYDLSRVEAELDKAPCSLFCLYQANKFRFAKHLLYSSLPQVIYNRLITLLAVREMMLKEQRDSPTDEVQVAVGKKTITKAEIRRVIEQMSTERELKYKYDFTWLMMVMNETSGFPSFYSPSSFVEYLESCELKIDIPNRSTIRRYYNKVLSKYPNWTFEDADEMETTRRKNIAKRFLKLLFQSISQ